MRRVLIFGRGGAGKSTLAQGLGEMLDLPVVELDKVYWRPDGRPTPAAVWQVIQEKLVAGEKWILDGDLGPDDIVQRRLQAADTIIVLDLPAYLCAWRVLRRSRERLDFWWWMARWRHSSMPTLKCSIEQHAAGAEVVWLRTRRDVVEFLAHAGRPG
jgi:adenylate kinase family enzyme